MGSDFDITSRLASRYRSDLERLMFFNANQQGVQEGIVQSIERYGMPQIVIDQKNQVRIRTETLEGLQALFATRKSARDNSPVGVIVYFRGREDTLVVIHVGIHEDYSATGRFANRMLFFELVTQLRRQARKIKGITGIEFLYGKGQTRRLTV